MVLQETLAGKSALALVALPDRINQIMACNHMRVQ